MTGKQAFEHLRPVFFAAAIATLVGCTPIIRNHGFIPPQEELDRIVVGQDTRESVRALIGPPTTGGVLDGSGFYYVASQFRHFGALAPQIVDRQVLSVTFNESGVVSDVALYGLEDGRVVALSRRVTDSNLGNITIVRQILGNIGRFDAGTFLGES